MKEKHTSLKDEKITPFLFNTEFSEVVLIRANNDDIFDIITSQERTKWILVVDELKLDEKKKKSVFKDSGSGGFIPKELGKEQRVGRSFELTQTKENSSKVINKFFLKLPDDKAENKFDDFDRHFDEEIESLIQVNELEPPEQSSSSNTEPPLHVGRVARVYGKAYLHAPPSCRIKTPIPAILEEFIPGDSLNIWCKSILSSLKLIKENNSLEDQDDSLEKILWLTLAFALTNTVRRLHNHGVIHGSILPEHIILGDKWKLTEDPENPILILAKELASEKAGKAESDKLNSEERLKTISTSISVLSSNVWLVGFGTSAVLYDPDQREKVRKLLKTSRYASPEMKKSGGHIGIYSYPVDIFATGAVLFDAAMALRGDPQEESHKEPGKIAIDLPSTVDSLKQYIAKELHQHSNWKTASIGRIIDKALRKSQADRFLCAEEMMQFILNASLGYRQAFLSCFIDQNSLEDGKDKIIRSVLADKTKKNLSESLPPVTQLFSERLSEFITWQGVSFRNSHLEVWGNRDVILDSLCALMAMLTDGDSYNTRTIPAYWTDENLGSNGRVLVANKDLVAQGVKVKRIFTVSREFDELAIEEQLAIIQQREAYQEIVGNHTANYSLSYDVRVKRVESVSKMLEVERRDQCVAFIEIGENNKFFTKGCIIGLSFLSQGAHHQEFDQDYLKLKITKMRIRDMSSPDSCDQSITVEESKSNNGTHVAERFNVDWNDATTLDRYLNSGKSLEMLLQKKFNRCSDCSH